MSYERNLINLGSVALMLRVGLLIFNPNHFDLPLLPFLPRPPEPLSILARINDEDLIMNGTMVLSVDSFQSPFPAA